MKSTLLILAAGIGSRYGSLKQIDRVGPSGETIIDYSVYDAIRMGFSRVVFVIRRDIEKEFKEFFAGKFHGKIDMDYVLQELDNLPGGIKCPGGRTKPWGTAHAVMVASQAIAEPFIVINADDFYGAGSYKVITEYIRTHEKDMENNYCLVGYVLKNTLSEHGAVSRGVCGFKDDRLVDIVERKKVKRAESGIVFEDKEGNIGPLGGDEIVSMNLWGFAPSVFGHFRKYFGNFIRENSGSLKAEMQIPDVIGRIIQDGVAGVELLKTDERWFGVTYREDKPYVIEEIRKLVDGGIYPVNLWGN